MRLVPCAPAGSSLHSLYLEGICSSLCRCKDRLTGIKLLGQSHTGRKLALPEIHEALLVAKLFPGHLTAAGWALQLRLSPARQGGSADHTDVVRLGR